MKQIKLLFVLFLGIALSTAYSCNKDDDDNGGGSSTPTKCYIKKELNDDGSYTLVEYNANHQVIKSTDYDDAGSPTAHIEMTYVNDILAVVEEYENGILVGRIEYSYNALGYPTKADLFMDDGTGFTKIGYYDITFTGDNLTKQSMHADLMGQTIKVSESVFTYDAGNVTKMKTFAFNAQTLKLELESITEYAYDTKLNPYHGVGVDYLMADPQFLSKANITINTASDNKGVVMDDKSYNTVYEYNDSKYPIKGTATSFDNSNSEVTIMEYDCM